MSLYVVKNDKGEWLYSDEYTDWVDQLSQASFYDTFEDADDDIECWELSNAYVVELTEAPEKVVVSEEQGRRLHNFVTGLTDWANVRATMGHGDVLKAIKCGWEVEKPKRWNVKVPHADGYWFYLRENHKLAPISDRAYARDFTDAEIEHYGLQDCEKALEVTDYEQ